MTTTPEAVAPGALAEPETARVPDGWATIHGGKISELSIHKPRAPGDIGWHYYAQRGFSAPQPVYLGFPSLPAGVVAGLLERQRQVASEGFAHEHDDLYSDGQLLRAAACYLLKAAGLASIRFMPWWPWDRKWFKGDNRKRNVEKAFALIVAEMERCDRLESRSETPPTA